MHTFRPGTIQNTNQWKNSHEKKIEHKLHVYIHVLGVEEFNRYNIIGTRSSYEW